MAQGPQLSEEAESSIARQIADRFTSPALTVALAAAVEASSRQAARPALAESFPIYLLGYEDVVTGRGRLSDRLSPTGQWHHQVAFGSDPRLFARSRHEEDDTWSVKEVVRSDLPRSIGRTIAWIDDNLPEEAEAALLVAPAYFLTAFLLTGLESVRVVVTDRPEGMGEIEVDHVYDEFTFLDLLSRQPPVRGLPERRAGRERG